MAEDIATRIASLRDASSRSPDALAAVRRAAEGETALRAAIDADAGSAQAMVQGAALAAFADMGGQP